MPCADFSPSSPWLQSCFRDARYGSHRTPAAIGVLRAETPRRARRSEQRSSWASWPRTRFTTTAWAPTARRPCTGRPSPTRPARSTSRIAPSRSISTPAICFAGSFLEGHFMIHFIVHDEGDSVGVVVVEGVKATQNLTGWIMDQDREIEVRAQSDIPIGHKLAIRALAAEDTVIKYGVDIGRAVAPIKIGEHAHVHNIKTKRW